MFWWPVFKYVHQWLSLADDETAFAVE